MKELKNRLDEIKERHLYRSEKYLESAQESYVYIDNKKFLLLSSNNYLGLSNRMELKDAGIREVKKYGVGTGGSRLTTGTYRMHKKLENTISKFLNRDDTILFNTGYMANIGVIQSICTEDYTIISDSLNHASIIDGCKLAKAEVKIFKHNNMEDLEQKLLEIKTKYSLIITEGIFSMDGDLCKLDEIIEIGKRFGSYIMVDDAHGLGVVGDTGKGILEYFNVNKEVDIYLGTLSKAIGCEGGFVSGKDYIIDFLRNNARSYIYSTAINIGTCASAIEAFKIIEKEKLTLQLNMIKLYTIEKLKEIGIETMSDGGIIKILIYDEKKAIEIRNKLFDKGIFISAVRYPTVEKGKAILRLCLMATHTKKDIDLFIKELGKIYDTKL